MRPRGSASAAVVAPVATGRAGAAHAPAPRTRSYLLPPIILNAGLSVERHRFFLNLPSIMLFGIVGTLACFVIVGLALYLLLGFAVFELQARPPGPHARPARA
jgi:NhaP-type Na+/H+ or K+/H+ antiporter